MPTWMLWLLTGVILWFLYKKIKSGKNAMFQNLSNDAFSEKMKNADHVVLDVRTDAEYASGHLPKAKLINVMDASFSGKVDALDKSKTYLVYCRSGSRSRGACEIMASRGFQVFNLDNGIMGWNGPVER